MAEIEEPKGQGPRALRPEGLFAVSLALGTLERSAKDLSSAALQQSGVPRKSLHLNSHLAASVVWGVFDGCPCKKKPTI